MRFLTLAIPCLVLAATSNEAAAMKLTCNGVLTVKEGELQLKPDPGSPLWCDASFEGERYKVAKPGIADEIRAACSEGDRCHVAGEVLGHGAFYWVKITSVKKLPSSK